MVGALEGLRVLDLSRVLAGPYCTMMLGDMGAEVIKIEQPGIGDETRRWGPPWAGGQSAYYLAVNRNKKSLTLNIRDPRGKEILRSLVCRSDVVVENFKAGALNHLGIGYDELSADNPGLVWCSITGYGSDGPYAGRPGYDFIAQGEAGIMSITGEPDGEPMKVGVAIVDVTAGLFAHGAILAALLAKTRNGIGQKIDVSLLSSAVAWLANVGSSYLISGEQPKRYGNAHPSIVPYQAFRVRDMWINVAAGNDRQFQALCQVLEVDHLATDRRFLTNPDRVVNREELIPLLEDVLSRRDADNWLGEMGAAGIPCGPINSLDRVFRHPQVLHRNMVAALNHPTAGSIKVVGSPVLLSETPPSVRSHPPLLGEHTDDVLRELVGLGPDEIAGLRVAEVV
ncbi:MAG: CaiB/BaiF CoA transferase family protein [Chloroflexota bacterium]|nr:MAG: formyl-CoA transferase [Chloroflexota bacterium]